MNNHFASVGNNIAISESYHAFDYLAVSVCFVLHFVNIYEYSLLLSRGVPTSSLKKVTFFRLLFIASLCHKSHWSVGLIENIW